jgi:hypothetical protein
VPPAQVGQNCKSQKLTGVPLLYPKARRLNRIAAHLVSELYARRLDIGFDIKIGEGNDFPDVPNGRCSDSNFGLVSSEHHSRGCHTQPK